MAVRCIPKNYYIVPEQKTILLSFRPLRICHSERSEESFLLRVNSERNL